MKTKNDYKNDCSLDSLKCNNTETYVDIHCNVLRWNKMMVTLREANGICQKVFNNRQKDVSDESGLRSEEAEQNPTGLGEATASEMPEMTTQLSATEKMDIPESSIEFPSASTIDRSGNRKLRWFLKIHLCR